MRVDMPRGRIGWPARRPGNSQRDSRFVAVFMLPRWARCWSTSVATGPGMGDGGSQQDLVAVSDDVVDGEPGDPSDGLGVEQQYRRGGEGVHPLLTEVP